MRFLLVDRILALEPGLSAEAEMSLPPGEELFRDHFPGFPVVPGVLLTEMMAQTAGKALNAQRQPRGNAMMVEVRNARFRAWVRPGERIHLKAQIHRDGGDFALAKCSASVEGRAVCSAELMFAFKPVAEFAPDYRDEVLESFMAGRSSSASAE